MCEKATPRLPTSRVSVPDVCHAGRGTGGAFRRPPNPPPVRAVGRDPRGWAPPCAAGPGSRLGGPAFGRVAHEVGTALLLRVAGHSANRQARHTSRGFVPRFSQWIDNG
jgi:hypothetical protein